MDNAARTISAMEQAKVETVIELFELGLLVDKDNDKRKFIESILRSLFFEQDRINYWTEYFNV